METTYYSSFFAKHYPGDVNTILRKIQRNTYSTWFMDISLKAIDRYREAIKLIDVSTEISEIINLGSGIRISDACNADVLIGFLDKIAAYYRFNYDLAGQTSLFYYDLAPRLEYATYQSITYEEALACRWAQFLQIENDRLLYHSTERNEITRYILQAIAFPDEKRKSAEAQLLHLSEHLYGQFE